MDVVFLATVLILYVLSHLLIAGFERLRSGKQ